MAPSHSAWQEASVPHQEALSSGLLGRLHDMAAVFPSITYRESIAEATVYLITSFQKSHSIIPAIPPPGDARDIPMDMSVTTQDTNTRRQDPGGWLSDPPVARRHECLSMLLSPPTMLSLLVLLLSLNSSFS